MQIKFESVAVDFETVRKGWNSLTEKFTFVDEFDALIFLAYRSEFLIGPIGEWARQEGNAVTVFTCSAD